MWAQQEAFLTSEKGGYKTILLLTAYNKKQTWNYVFLNLRTYVFVTVLLVYVVLHEKV